VTTANSRTGTIRPLAVMTALGWTAALATIFFYAPTERTEGIIQRMMYLHVPAAFSMYIGYGIVFFASCMYLFKRQARWDELATAAAEVGTLYATMMITTGPIWAKPVWGTYWTWDARLTSALILWLIYVAYLMLRAYGGHAEEVARYCAVLAIIGFVDIPIIHYSVRWWRTFHPDAKILTEGSAGRGLDSAMLTTFAIAFAATVLTFALLLTLRLRMERQGRRLEALHRESMNAAPIVIGSSN
jgi:heme exporter protein C